MTQRHIILIMISSFLLISETAYAQTDTLIVDRSYETSNKKPLVADAGTIVINQTDSLYLINKARFKYYEQLRVILRDSIDITIDDVIFKYEKLIAENEMQMMLLLQNCNKTALLNQKIISTTEASLKSTLQEIDSTQTSLDKANESLTKVEKGLKKWRRNQILGKIGVGIGGIAIGVLIGVLVL